MATRSTIALEFADGTVQQVYAHWDGYLDGNGKTLQEHYSDPFKLRDLIDLGDISSLGSNIGQKHPFSPFISDKNDPEYSEKAALIERAKSEDWTVFYGRDRGETDIAARKFKDYADYKANFQNEEYNYILRTDGKWYVNYYETCSEFIELAQAFNKEKEAV